MTVCLDGLSVDWFGYATLRLESSEGTVVYVDPGRYGVLTGEWEPDSPDVSHPDPVDYRARDGDYVFVTHDHHYDSDGVERVAREDATVVVYDGVDATRISRPVTAVAELPYDVERIGRDDVFSTDDVTAWSLDAYNDPAGPHVRPDGTPVHPEGFGVGFLLSLDGTRVFWPGDTDVLPGHERLDVSLFCPPIGGSFTMDRREAAALADALAPDLVVPIHYDTFEALETDSAAFAAALERRGVPVELDED